MNEGRVAVFDVGKTNAKLALVDLSDLSEIAVLTRPNTVLPGPPYPHYDVEGHWEFLLESLAGFQREHGVDAIVTTTHGAACALIGADGRLAAPVLDYEHPGPDETADSYDAIRPPFEETGAPRLAGGLNLGAQIHWQFQSEPGLRERTKHIVTYPQYWGFRLTGNAACDVSSLGAHTDFWNATDRCLSALADRLGIVGKLAPVTPSDAVLGPILPEIAARTGLQPGTPVHCGIHDSNASLLPHLLRHKPPFSVVSTGTWISVMAVGGEKIALDPGRGTLMNVNALGDPVPSALYMGGREFELVDGGRGAEPTNGDINRVLSSQTMLMPALVTQSGPFAGRASRWIGSEPEKGSGERNVAASFYVALVTAECLRLVGHRGPVIVEGPFARNPAFRLMLAAATGSEVRVMEGATGTSQGAALLVRGDPGPEQIAVVQQPPGGERGALLGGYASRWRERLAA